MNCVLLHSVKLREEMYLDSSYAQHSNKAQNCKILQFTVGYMKQGNFLSLFYLSFFSIMHKKHNFMKLHQHVVENLFKIIMSNSATKGWFMAHDVWLIATLEWWLTCTSSETVGPSLLLSYQWFSALQRPIYFHVVHPDGSSTPCYNIVPLT